MDGTRPARPELRLFVLHHAGGSHVPFRHWPAGLPDTWDVRLLDAPGHGHLMDRAPIQDAGLLADFLLRAVAPAPDVPYALFGHSMGALLAYEIACRAVASGLPRPVWTGVSARPAPCTADRSVRYGDLSDAALRDRLKRLGGTPDEVFDDPDLWAVFAPVIRADLRVVENWRPRPGTGPLPVALSAFAGAGDHAAPAARMAGWAERTEHFIGLHVLDGGHFYFAHDPGPLLRRIEQDARTALAASSRLR
ncbi:alpha/beta fold hydrolase (plasmid) [Streptomyces sp. HUAS MG91]|uniref:Alpha/beta fold hydrolase n=1 Tax=Streptomyces tabacisoli TaxID=3156398 RepID=A0AAU8J685_9ACTN